MLFKSSIKHLTAQVCDATGDAMIFTGLAHKIITITCFTLFFFQLNAQEQKTNALDIHFINIAGDKKLFSDSIYTNAFGEQFSVRNFMYYVSNIILYDSAAGKSQLFSNEYFLIDEKDDASKIIQLRTSFQHISSIRFLLGVDSLKNVSGVQTGTLDPAKGMFWTWNSGYVMAKLEGNSPAAKTPAQVFSYHVGGYKTGEAVARNITLKIQKGIAINNEHADLFITADILKWFNGNNAVSIANTAFCHEPGKLAMQLADNYATMFRIAQ